MGRLTLGDKFVGTGCHLGVKAQVTHVETETVIDLDNVCRGYGTVQHGPYAAEIAPREVDDKILRGAAKIKDGHGLVLALSGYRITGAHVAYQAGSDPVDDAVAAAGDKANLLLRMQVAVEADIARRIALPQGGIDFVHVRDFLQLVIEVLVMRCLVGPPVDDIDVFHTCKLMMVMSSLCG